MTARDGMTPKTPAAVVPEPAAAEQVSGGDVLGEVTSPPDYTWYDDLGPAAGDRLRSIARTHKKYGGGFASPAIADLFRYIHQQTIKVSLLRKHADAMAAELSCKCIDKAMCALCRYRDGVVR